MDRELPDQLDSITAEELLQARDELVAEGLLVVVEEIDPRTGKLRNRYFHKKFAAHAS